MLNSVSLSHIIACQNWQLTHRCIVMCFLSKSLRIPQAPSSHLIRQMVNNNYYLHCPFWACVFFFYRAVQALLNLQNIGQKVSYHSDFHRICNFYWGIMLITWNFVALCLNQVVVLQIHWSKNLLSTNEVPESVPASCVAWHWACTVASLVSWLDVFQLKPQGLLCNFV